MATRQQQKGGRGVQYENLVPKSEWKDEFDATILIIDLPGFAKEQIKVTYVHTSRMIRVTGERPVGPVGDRQWIRFNEVFSVPENCLVDKIHGSFKNNFLTITMPKQTITKIPEKEKEKESNLPEGSKTMAAPLLPQEDKRPKLEEKRFLEESRRQEKVEETERKKAMDDFRAQERVIKKLEEEAKAKKQLEEEEEGKAKERKRVEEATFKKLEERKLGEEANLRKLEERNLVEEAMEERKLDEEATLRKMEKKKLGEKSKGKEKMEKPGSGSGSGSGSGFGAGKGLGYLMEKGKEIGKGGNGIMEKIRGKELTSEEKKLMVNVGVAALVIFALGAYVSYTICSSSSSSSSSSCSSPPSRSTKPE